MPTWKMRRRRDVASRLATLVACFALVVFFFAGSASAFAAGDPPGAKDWMNSPLVGGGTTPPGTTDVYFSAYLDRILYLDEQKYIFAVSMYTFLSWRDDRAAGDIERATNETTSGSRDCARMCVGQRAPSDASLCCDTLWLPSFVVRNANEFPQGRAQPYYITEKDGVVTWRVEFRCDFYTNLDVQAFPFDFQELQILFQLINLPGTGRVRVIPSARGLHLFSLGWGDDLSSFKTTSLKIEVSNTTFSKQFDRFLRFDETNNKSFDAAAAAAQEKARDQVEARSDPSDPAPLVPAFVPDPKDKKKVLPVAEPWGTDIEVVNVIIVMTIKRLWQYYIISAVIPILTATLLSFVVFAVPPNKLDTRLQTSLGLFLSLIAIQYVIEDALPKSSYVIPTRMLVLASYVVLGLIALESLVVFNLWHWPQVRAKLAGRREAVRRQAEITRLRLLLQQSRSRSGSGGGSGNGRGARALAASVSRKARGGGTSDGGETGGEGGRAAWASQLAPTRTPSSPPPPAPPGGGGGASAVDEPAKEVDVEGGGKVSPASPSVDPAGVVPSGSPTAATRNEATTMLLEDELEKALWHYRAWKVDVVSFCVMLFAYLIAALFIFGISVLTSRRAAKAFSYTS